MKFILLALVLAFSFGSAVAEKGSELKGFEFKKPPSTLSFILKSDGAQLNSGYQCEQDCWDDRTICINSGQNFTICSQALLQCIDACEGAGGLYQ